jgi:hypothetical protein
VAALSGDAKIARAGISIVAVTIVDAAAFDRSEITTGHRVAIALRTYLAVVASDRPVLAAIRDVIAGINSADVAVVAFDI